MANMNTLMLLLVPFGALALLAGAGAACAGMRASAVEDDAGRSFELWGLCVALTVVTILCAAAAWWWWAGWSDFSF
jgi:hypothetical protein